MRKQDIKLGIAPIAWTNDDMPDLGEKNTFEQCVSEMALAGYDGCEVGNKFPKDTAVLKRALALRNLRIANQWFSSFILTKPMAGVEKDFIAQCKFLKEMGADVIGASEQSYSIQGNLNAPVFGDKYVLNGEEWEKLASGLNRLGEIARDMGIKLTYHHHMGTVVQTAEETDRLLDMTDPRLVFLLYDTGHFAYCGEDYLQVLKRHIGRVKHVHLKDIRPEATERVKRENMSFLQGVRVGTFTVPGDGCIGFTRVFDILDRANYKGWMIVEAEQDPALADPLEYALKARKYIAEKAGI